jgi:hypothetical protein
MVKFLVATVHIAKWAVIIVGMLGVFAALMILWMAM